MSASKKLYIETFGCQMNEVDSERAVALLGRHGYQWTAEAGEADVILFNTCAVRRRPSEKIYARISQIGRRKKPGALIGVMGCVAQAEGQRMIERSADIGLVVGTQALGRLPVLLRRLEMGGGPVVDVRMPNKPVFEGLSASDRGGHRQRPGAAYVTIMEGCDKFCTFCIVPFTRGRERSRSAEQILAEMQALAEQAVKEVHLLGQNVSSYGLSRRFEGDGRMSFADLLALVAAKPNIPRIKFTTSHPRDFDGRIIQVIDSWPQLCPWIHLPPQTGSNQMLAMMNRGYTFEAYMRLVELIKNARADMSLTGDIIVGFPGETAGDFNQTVRLVRRAEFDGLYVFKYSPRPGTVAAKWTDDVPEEVKTERLMEINAVQREIQSRRWRRYERRIVEVLVEGKSAKSDQHWSGHSSSQKVVNFESSRGKLEGALVKVKITRINPNSLFGFDVESGATTFDESLFGGP